MTDPRTPPPETGFAQYGEMLVPSSLAEAEWAKLDAGTKEFDELSELHEAAALYEASMQVRERFSPETREIIEASGDWRLEFDSPYNRQAGYETLGILGQYSLLREWNIYERMAILERCHAAWERNPLANRAIELTTLFVIGNGLQLTAQDDTVRDIIDKFMKDKENDTRAAQIEVMTALQLDGEVLFRHFSERGQTKVAALRPWDIKWIVTDPEFRKRKKYYKQIATFWDGYTENVVVNEEIPAAEIIYAKINSLPYEVRGRPDLFRILPWVKAYKDWLEERVRVQRRKSIYYHMQLKNATAGQISATRAAYREPPPPGSFLVTNDNVTMTELSSRINAGDAEQDGRAIKLMAISGKGLPEYMLGEGAHATRATASTQELPALVGFAFFQSVAVWYIWQPILAQVIQNAVDAGLCPEMVTAVGSNGKAIQEHGKDKVVRAVDAFTANYKDITEPDPFNLAQALQIADANSWASKQTLSNKMGFDWAIEEDQIAAEQAKSMAQAYAMQPPMPPGDTAGVGQPKSAPFGRAVVPTNGRGNGRPPPNARPPMPVPAPAREVEAAPETAPEPEGDVNNKQFVAVMDAFAALANRPQQPVNITFPNALLEAKLPEQLAPTVNVTVPTPVVNVHPTFTVQEAEQPAQVININVPEQPAPIINVAAPDVTVNVPQTPVTLTMPPRHETVTIKRDKGGQITSLDKQEE